MYNSDEIIIPQDACADLVGHHLEIVDDDDSYRLYDVTASVSLDSCEKPTLEYSIELRVNLSSTNTHALAEVEVICYELKSQAELLAESAGLTVEYIEADYHEE